MHWVDYSFTTVLNFGPKVKGNTMKRRLCGHLLSGYPFIRAVEKRQLNTKVTKVQRGVLRRIFEKKRLSDHIVFTKNTIIHGKFQIFSLEKHKVKKNLLICIKI